MCTTNWEGHLNIFRAAIENGVDRVAYDVNPGDEARDAAIHVGVAVPVCWVFCRALSEQFCENGNKGVKPAGRMWRYEGRFDTCGRNNDVGNKPIPDCWRRHLKHLNAVLRHHREARCRLFLGVCID